MWRIKSCKWPPSEERSRNPTVVFHSSNCWLRLIFISVSDLKSVEEEDWCFVEFLWLLRGTLAAAGFNLFLWGDTLHDNTVWTKVCGQTWFSLKGNLNTAVIFHTNLHDQPVQFFNESILIITDNISIFTIYSLWSQCGDEKDCKWYLEVLKNWKNPVYHTVFIFFPSSPSSCDPSDLFWDLSMLMNCDWS